MIFTYRTTTLDGTISEGTIEADDVRAVTEKLRGSGLIPLKIVPRKEGLRKWGNVTFRSHRSDLITFTTELSALLNAGLPLDRGLQILSEISESAFIRKTVQALLKSIREGNSFSDALQKHPDAFPKLYVNMVRAGETGGILHNVLERLSEFLESSKELRDHVVSAMIYPVILMVTGLLSILLLFTFVLPRFSSIFMELGGSLPLPTQILLTFAGALKSFFWILLILFIGSGFVLRKYIRTENGRYQWDRWKLKIMGDILVKLETARFCRTLGTLLTGGVPLLLAMRNAKDVMTNSYMASTIDSVTRGAKEGKGIAQPLAEANVFPALALSMIKVGEETGKLNEMLTKVALIYEKNLREAIKRFVSFLEPAMILLMGLIIGFIVISMLMAIFSITDLPL